MAVPSQSTRASELGEIHRLAVVVASSPTPDHGPALGSVATSHIGGGAVWWQSPSTALARGWVRATAQPTLQRGFEAPPAPRATVGCAGGVGEPAAGRAPADAARGLARTGLDRAAVL